jgi:two-component system, OmpR family, sensor histidine kinase SenX3
MAWLKRKDNFLAASATSLSPLDENPQLEIKALLNLFDAESILLDGDDQVTHKSPGIDQFNLVKDSYLTNNSLLMLVRATRRSGESQNVTMELPRGPIGGGVHDLNVRTSVLNSDGTLAILIFDDSEFRRLDSTRRDFVANISHELKTPIGALSILSEAVIEASGDPEAIKRFASRMQMESKRLTDLVQEIINLSRLQDDDPLRRGGEVSVNFAILSAIDRSETSAEKKRIKIEYDQLSEGDISVLGDQNQITMAIENLIENAINYSDEDTKVGIGLKVTAGIVEISVTDQGIGIPAKEMERIFERFYRVDAARSRETGGTGLGLAIVKHVAQNHGGEIGVWSQEGSGSTFTLRFPIYTGENK